MVEAVAVVLEEPEKLALQRLALEPPGEADVVVDVEWSGISTGTERLLWLGRMPAFPGMGYPLVPGYESVGRVAAAGARSTLRAGQRVFVPGSRCFRDVRGLFGGAASRLVVPSERAVAIDDALEDRGVLLALAATAHHAMAAPDASAPDLIVGHGVLGRLLARVSMACGNAPPTVWEKDPSRRAGAAGYPVISPDEDERRDYRAIYDVSGDAALVDELIARLAPRCGAELVLAGFYSQRVGFDFPPAFMRELRLRVAAEWGEEDLAAVNRLTGERSLDLGGLITHHEQAASADHAYRTAFDDPSCLKMILDWRGCE